MSNQETVSAADEQPPQSPAAQPAAIAMATIRQYFPILNNPLPNGKRLVYLDNAATTQKPHCVIDKERECYEHYFANAHRGAHQLGELITEKLEATRATVCKFLNAREPAEIIFTAGTTMSINMVANGWARKQLSPDDEILINVMEHHANIVPWQQAAKATGAKLRYIALTADGQLDLRDLDQQLNSRTKIIAVTGMSNVLGTLNPIADISKRAKTVKAKLLVDAAQLVAHSTVDVQQLDIDFLAFSGHKMYGPSGVGVLYGKRELLEEMEPLLFGGGMIETVQRTNSTWAELPAKFEAGTAPLAQIVALKSAVDFMQAVGYSEIRNLENELLQVATTRLQEIPGLQILGPDLTHKGAVISFVMEGANPQDLAMLMDRQGVAVRSGHHCAMLLHEQLGISSSLRISFGMYNTLEEIDQLVDSIHFARKKLRLG